MHNDQNLIECSIIILVCKVWFAFYCFPQFDLTIIPTTHLFLRVASYEYFLTPHLCHWLLIVIICTCKVNDTFVI